MCLWLVVSSSVVSLFASVAASVLLSPASVSAVKHLGRFLTILSVVIKIFSCRDSETAAAVEEEDQSMDTLLLEMWVFLHSDCLIYFNNISAKTSSESARTVENKMDLMVLYFNSEGLIQLLLNVLLRKLWIVKIIVRLFWKCLTYLFGKYVPIFMIIISFILIHYWSFTSK